MKTSSNVVAPRTRSPPTFFALVFILSIPFWLLGAVVRFQLAPGLPISALAVLCPVAAASLLSYRERGAAGVIELLKRSFDYERTRAKIWYVPILLLMPGAGVLSYGLMLLMGLQVPAPQIAVLPALVLLVACFAGALAEELGWSGYAIDPMQERWNALWASILLGIVWAVWHYVPLLQAHRSPAWMAWWCLRTVAFRVLIVWLYNNTDKSVFAAALVHTMSNVTWQLFPVHGSHFDERLNALILASIAAIVVALSGRRTLPREKSA